MNVFSLPASSSLNPAGLEPISRIASDTMNMSLRTFTAAAAGTVLIEP